VAKDSGFVLLRSPTVKAPHSCQHVTSQKSAPPVNHSPGYEPLHTKFRPVFLELKRKVPRIHSLDSGILSFHMLRNRIMSLAASTFISSQYDSATRRLKHEFKDVSVDVLTTSLHPPYSPVASAASLAREDIQLKSEFNDLFPDRLP